MSLSKSINDVKQPIKLLLKGSSGAGKTWKAAHFPSPCFLNFDGNLTGLQKLPPALRANVRYVDPYTDENDKEVEVKMFWNNFLKILQRELDNELNKTIVFDSLSTFGDALRWQLLGAKTGEARATGGKDAAFQFWDYFRNHILLLCDELLHNPALDKHVIFIAHDANERDELTTKIQRELMLDGQMKNKFELHFTDVWECLADVPAAGAVKWKIRTVPSTSFSAKCSLALPEEFEFDKEKENIIKQLL